MTTHEIMNLGFQQVNSMMANEYINGIVKVQTNDNYVTSVFVTDIAIDGIKNIEELQYLCKKLQGVA